MVEARSLSNARVASSNHDRHKGNPLHSSIGSSSTGCGLMASHYGRLPHSLIQSRVLIMAANIRSAIQRGGTEYSCYTRPFSIIEPLFTEPLWRDTIHLFLIDFANLSCVYSPRAIQQKYCIYVEFNRNEIHQFRQV